MKWSNMYRQENNLFDRRADAARYKIMQQNWAARLKVNITNCVVRVIRFSLGRAGH